HRKERNAKCGQCNDACARPKKEHAIGQRLCYVRHAPGTAIFDNSNRRFVRSAKRRVQNSLSFARCPRATRRYVPREAARGWCKTCIFARDVWGPRVGAQKLAPCHTTT